ncbi:512_t:CDS:10 [Funneliformis mosseae]|uniref:512_t:CDS:1 n=1 Tax=Funneliformis mosseae TaxID=27381 RepID=A0A9N8VHJ7_FUNMO|nr:512_t:CDS:10 [Funneliformis mosseae]
MTTIRVLTVGSANGKLTELFAGVKKIITNYGPFDLLLCVGDLFGENNSELESLISGEIEVPITSYFMYGERELPDIVKERIASNNGEFCPNLFYLGQTSSLTTTQGVKIAFASGILNSPVTGLPNTVDILLTHEWPKDITRLSQNAPATNVSGSEHVAKLALSVKPRYHLATSEKVFYQREPYQNTPSPNLINDEGDSQMQFGHPTWFIGLAEVGNATKSKWYYGFNLEPFMHLSPSAFTKPPKMLTGCPYIFAGKKRRTGDNSSSGGNYFWGSGNASEPSTKRGKRAEYDLPPNYVCKKCKNPGHWIKDCPALKGSRVHKSRPPSDYICNKCKQAGVHYIVNCPDYSCNLCGDNGHPPKECPSKDKSLFNKAVCWFCLSNPKIVKRLIVSLGEEIYLSLAKGPLVDSRDENVPGGGHVLLVAIQHYPTFQEVPIDEQTNMMDELEKYKIALKKLFNEYDAGMVMFEVSRTGGIQHCHLQVIPIPLKYDSNMIREAFIKEASDSGFELLPVSSSLPPHHFKVDLPDGTSLIHEINPNEKFDVQFGRKVLANLMGCSQRIDWRACELTEEQEQSDAEEFRKAFKPYDPMAEN